MKYAFIGIGTLILAYFTHLFWALTVLMGDATTSQIILAIAGLFPPLGVAHGLLIWVQSIIGVFQ